MPYTKDEERNPYKRAFDIIEAIGIHTKGDLEYLICNLQDIFAAEREYRYAELHDCKYATQHAAYEFGRRFLDPREDDALTKNGEVFTRMKRRHGI